MDLSLAALIGFVAGSLATSSYVPQVWKCWRTGDVEAISKRMFVVRTVGLILWAVYGFGVGSLPILVFSSLSLVLSVTILVLKLRHSQQGAPAQA